MRFSRGERGEKTSVTASCILARRLTQPRFKSHQLKARYLRFVSRSVPYASSGERLSSLFSRQMGPPLLAGEAAEAVAREITELR